MANICEGGIVVEATKRTAKPETVRIQINGRLVTLIFTPEPNREAASIIQKTLINAYLIKAV